jgi:FAD/FMN-containing dehydrogenase/Fe-S oxidoreductase
MLEATGCEVRRDDLTRNLYATDASIHQVVPAAVAFPRDAAETASVLSAAAGAGLAVTPRGAGTGLAGGALGDGLVLDLARRTRWIANLDLERRTVRVGAGVVLDQLNAFLKPHGLWFGPDVATSSRATLGGMIANNSSGAHAPVYGTTVDHVVSLEVVLGDGTVSEVGAELDGLPTIRERANALVTARADAIAERLPPGLVKRRPGYGFERYLGATGDLSRLVAGSEGTLAAITAAELRVVPRPTWRGLAVIFFASVEEAMAATVKLLDLGAAAIEHIDRLLFDQTRGRLAFARARALLDLDERPCEAMLVVELFDHVEDGLAEVARRKLGLDTLLITDPNEQELVWSLRRAGLSLLTSRRGPAKPTTGIEDVCVRPEQLPAYVAGLKALLEPLGLEASFYGHAASGELHVRPTLDLHTAEDVAALRRIADGVSELTRRFGGSLAAEHGVGITRTAYLAEHLGPELVELTAEVKRLFDPRGVLNPGKIIDDGRFRIDADLRQGAGTEIRLPFHPQMHFVDRDGAFVANLEQCNGCGSCRKDAPTMCPTFIATGDEAMSTRGRANTIRAALEGRLDDPVGRGVLAAGLEEVLESCLSCKACKAECPSNVDLAQLKADLVHARHRLDGVPLLDRVLAAADLLGRIGTRTAPLANAMLASRPVRWLLELMLGLNADRPLPPFASERFDRWFARREPAPAGAERHQVILWDDTWVRYHEPGIGRAAVALLEAAGFAVRLAEGRACCGRPAASRGLLDEARRLGEHNLALLAGGDTPIVFLEPSCWSMFVDDYRQLGLAGADAVAERTVLLETFLATELERRPDALSFAASGFDVAIHAHCHAKALADLGAMVELVGKVPGSRARLLDTGCCGMAGAFGMVRAKDRLSRAVARPLLERIDALPAGALLVASGTSCRHQVGQLAGARALHMAELLASALEGHGEVS